MNQILDMTNLVVGKCEHDACRVEKGSRRKLRGNCPILAGRAGAAGMRPAQRRVALPECGRVGAMPGGPQPAAGGGARQGRRGSPARTRT
ncbi:hypothetical protein, partial [Tahibacter caeni]|uniref:hypothetical protein n=1 Tax=Tahibacter caeni TaxID=1453545 RepID=UPI00214937C7